MTGVIPFRADFSNTAGLLKALHGVNNGPICFGGMVDLTERHRELALPCTRLHDCGWPHPVVVDLPAIFPDFSADTQRPESYTFDKTDDYLTSLVPLTRRVVYRLGTSIEHTSRRYHTHPPADFRIWARACVGLIRHLNDGWAGGHHFCIQDFEIWNEPDLGPPMWSGSAEQYFELYAVSAAAIKAYDASLRVGGPALANPNGEFAEAFLQFVHERHLPLDFFSWHTYTADPTILKQNALNVRALLDRHGFNETESLLTEWNCFGGDWDRLFSDPGYTRNHFERNAGADGAAFTASSLVLLQDAAVDEACYYTADTQWFGVFDEFGVPQKPFFALKAAARLMDTPVRVTVEGGSEKTGLAALAGLSEDGQRAAILISNYRDPATELELEMVSSPFGGSEIDIEILTLDDRHDLEPTRSLRARSSRLVINEPLPAPSVLMVRLAG